MAEVAFKNFSPEKNDIRRGLLGKAGNRSPESAEKRKKRFRTTKEGGDEMHRKKREIEGLTRK